MSSTSSMYHSDTIEQLYRRQLSKQFEDAETAALLAGKLYKAKSDLLDLTEDDKKKATRIMEIVISNLTTGIDFTKDGEKITQRPEKIKSDNPLVRFDWPYGPKMNPKLFEFQELPEHVDIFKMTKKQVLQSLKNSKGTIMEYFMSGYKLDDCQKMKTIRNMMIVLLFEFN